MWLSEKMSRQAAQQADLCRGVVSIGGENTAVLTDGEEREVSVLSPGGYFWRPALKERVLVSRAEGGCVLGRVQEACDLTPGEICIRTGAASIRLLPSGDIFLTGKIHLNGVAWEEEAQ